MRARWTPKILSRVETICAVAPRTLHGTVVDAAHAYRVEILVSAVGLEALLPVLRDPFRIRQEIIGGLVVPGPLADIVAQQRLAVGRAHDDAIAVRNDLVLRDRVERGRAFVHRRPERVGLQPQQELEDLRVGPRADVADFGLEGLCRPRLQPPILVVDEDAAVLHGGRAKLAGSCGDEKVVAVRGSYVRPPVPGRDADCPRQLEHAECRATPVAARDYQRAVHRRDQEALPFALDPARVEPPVGHKPVDERTPAQGADEDGGPVRPCALNQDGRLPARHALHIIPKEARGKADAFEVPRRHANRRHAQALGQLEIASLKIVPHPGGVCGLQRKHRRGKQQDCQPLHGRDRVAVRGILPKIPHFDSNTGPGPAIPVKSPGKAQRCSSEKSPPELHCSGHCVKNLRTQR